MNKVNINGNEYEVIDVLEKISITDSFVLVENKIGKGSGEAKLYVGYDNNKLTSFFGERGFVIDCILSKNNLLNYLNSAKQEYLNPNQEYLHKDKLPNLWEERIDKVSSFSEYLTFSLFDQNQINGPRIYLKSNLNDTNYKLIRELALPILSYINIYKLQNQNLEKKIFFFELNINKGDNNLTEKQESQSIINSHPPIPIIEEEDFGEEQITKPYDPNKIRIDHQNINLGSIIENLMHDEIDLNPDFQREGDLWSDSKKSQLIESILLGLPLPSFYFSEDESSKNNQIKWQVVDGLQRLSTFKSFIIDKTLKLQGLEFLKSYEGKKYEDLTREDARKISGFKVNIYIIDKQTPKNVKFLIFKKVNTAGLVLTAQEMRHALNQGVPTLLLKELANFEEFKKATCYSIPSKRQEDRDFTNRFVAFYLLGYNENYDGSLDEFLNIGMSKISELSNFEIEKLKSDFKKAMILSFEIFGIDAFRKRFRLNDNRKPISKAVFDTLSVNLAWLSDFERVTLSSKKDSFSLKLIESFNNDDVFLRSTSTGTATKSNVKIRFEKIKSIIDSILNNDK
jgi:hypothetical protein